MPFQNVLQPEFIKIDDMLRLRKYDGNYEIAIPWYQDPVVYYNSEGITDPKDIPDADYVKGIYRYLSEHGECYWIEVLEKGAFVPIGDVTLKEENPPIAIGVAQYRGVGIGTKVMRAIIQRAKELGFSKLYDSKVYPYNTVSRKMHEALGFKCVSADDCEMCYELDLTENKTGCIKATE